MSAERSGDPGDALLVADNPGDAHLTRETFDDDHVAETLQVVRDGIEALDVRSQRSTYADAPSPNLVFLDLALPRTDCDEVLEEIRDDEGLETVPVIVSTGSAAVAEVLRSAALCVNADHTEPIGPREFIEAGHSLQPFWLSVVRLPSGTSE